jgi:hypothetical protein
MTSQQKIELCLRASLLAREALNLTERPWTGGLVLGLQDIRRLCDELEAFARKVIDKERNQQNTPK